VNDGGVSEIRQNHEVQTVSGQYAGKYTVIEYHPAGIARQVSHNVYILRKYE
jgi:hypothetical protein